ncbi:MAG TPA: TonB-dependent receptor, partial [Bryobacteraceae bacterium]
MKNRRRGARGSLIRTALLLGCSSLAWNQSTTTGALAGTVRNTGGAPLPGVAVRLMDAATNQVQTSATGADGEYRFALLAPGRYEARFALTGFKTARMESVMVSVSEAPTLDAVLEPGEAGDVTACQCHFAIVTSSTGQLVDAKTITAVPLTTRNFTQVLSMSSGSAADVNNAGTLGRGTRNVNVNGNTSAGSYSLDGAFAPSAVPNPDTISELKIHTSQYDAIYGAQVPSTALITKSGEKDFHGDAWEFVRNDIFNANSFFLNATGQPKEHLKQNQYGGTIGGPVIRDKLFFFTSYQGTRQVNGLDQTSTAQLILPGLTSDRSAAALAAQFCPGNHLMANGQADPRYLTFAGGKQLDCHNQSTNTTTPINPVALRLLQMKNPDGSYYIPNPQTILTSGSNAGLGFSSYSRPSTYNENQALLNGDYLVSPKNTITARGYIATIDQFRTFGSPQGYPGAPMVPGPGTPQALGARDYVASVALTSMLTKRVVNEARVSLTRSVQSATGEDTPSAASLGMTPADRLFPEPPEMTVIGPLGSFRLFGTPGNDFATANKYYSLSDTLSWVHGRQTLRFGGFLLVQDNWRDDNGTARGRLYFQTFEDFLIGQSAAGNGSPFGRSNIQTIQASEGSSALGEVESHYRSYYGAPFFQDDVKVRSRLTLNLGLRWEYIGPAY